MLDEAVYAGCSASRVIHPVAGANATRCPAWGGRRGGQRGDHHLDLLRDPVNAPSTPAAVPIANGEGARPSHQVRSDARGSALHGFRHAPGSHPARLVAWSTPAAAAICCASASCPRSQLQKIERSGARERQCGYQRRSVPVTPVYLAPYDRSLGLPPETEGRLSLVDITPHSYRSATSARPQASTSVRRRSSLR